MEMLLACASEVRQDIHEGPGYSVAYGLTGAELDQLRSAIIRQYLNRLQACCPDVAAAAELHGIENYHLLSAGMDHSNLWPKAARILPADVVTILRSMRFFRALEREFGPVLISDNEINWRLVRPNAPDDIGPIHADRWFRELGYGRMPPGYQRFKIWIAIATEPGSNGLCVKPGSHMTNRWKYHTETRHGIPKPVIDEDVDALQLQLLHLGPGDIVMFHDSLLHGGVINRGSRCRVSAEFTLFYRREAGR